MIESNNDELEMDIRDRHFEEMSSEEWIHCILTNDFTPEELCWIYCCGMEWCGLLTDPENLAAVTKVMLDRGMNPNQLVTAELPDDNPEENFYFTPLISVTRYGDDSAEAESLKLLLEHGGDPNTIYSFEGAGEFDENVFEFYAFEEYVYGPDLDCGRFYSLLLCAAYGGKYPNGYIPFTMLIEAPISIFKDYDRYWYEYEKLKDQGSILFVIEKETGRRMARYHRW